MNLQSALKRLFERKHESLKQIATAEQTQEEQTQSELSPHALSEKRADGEQNTLALSGHEEKKTKVLAEARPLSPTTAQVEARRAKRKSRYEEVIRLHEQGVSQVAIATMLELHRDTVRRYLSAPAFPEIVRPKHGSKLDPYPNSLYFSLRREKSALHHRSSQM